MFPGYENDFNYPENEEFGVRRIFKKQRGISVQEKKENNKNPKKKFPKTFSEVTS